MSDEPALLLPGALPDPLAGFPFARNWMGARGDARNFLPAPGTDGWRSAVAARDASPTPPLAPEALAEIEAFNRACGNEGGARLVRQLAGADALVVVTGQQPNLLASPLYILLKALSACAVARRAAETADGRRAVVPVFWVASDDHDFHELRSCHFRSADGTLENLGARVTRGGAPEGSPAFEWELEPEIVSELIRAADEALPAGEAWRMARELVRLGLSGERPGFESAFCRTLAALLGENQPMVFVTPRMLWMRRAQRSVLRADFERPQEAARLLEKRGEQMAAAGYAPLISRDRNVLNAFYLMDRTRLRLVVRGDEVVAENPVSRQGLYRFSMAQLRDELEQYPERFSPNVVTRPMVQDSVLPTIAYVGGPGEISYLAQLAPVYEAFGVRQSAVALRASATLIPPGTARELAALGVRPTLASSGGTADPAAMDRLLSERLLVLAPETAPLLAQVRRFAAETGEGLSRLRSVAGETPRRDILPALEKTSRSIQHSLDKLQRRLWRQVAGEGGEVWQRYARTTAMLQPTGPPQERILAPHNFLTGMDSPDQLADILMRTIRFDDPRPQLIFLDQENESH